MESRQARRIGIGAFAGAIIGGVLGYILLDNIPFGLGIGAAFGALLAGAWGQAG